MKGCCVYTVRIILSSLFITMTCTGFFCNDEEAPTVYQGDPTTYQFTASSTTATLLTGEEISVILSNGTSPYSLISNSNPGVVEVTVNGSKLIIVGIAPGTTVLTIREGSTAERTVSVTITVVNTISFLKPGSLSFSSSTGDVSISGRVSLSTVTIPFGDGVGAVQRFGSTTLTAIKVHSPTKIDLFEAEFVYATSLIAGTYYYPSGGNKVQIIYEKNINPQVKDANSTLFIFLEATAVITSFNDSVMTGTFSGTGKNLNNTTEGITITNGTFSVPILRLGGNEERSIRGVVDRLKRKYSSRQ